MIHPVAWRCFALGSLLLLGAVRASDTLAAGKTVSSPEPAALGFEVLASFPYALPDITGSSADSTAPKPEIPAAIRDFHGRMVAVTGYMMPLQLEEGLARQFVLVRNLASCCYGMMPNLNEYVLVTMGKGVRPVMDVPITVIGTLKVGETYEDGFLVGIYQLDGDKLNP
jgi:hypothetical protein